MHLGGVALATDVGSTVDRSKTNNVIKTKDLFRIVFSQLVLCRFAVSVADDYSYVMKDFLYLLLIISLVPLQDEPNLKCVGCGLCPV